MFLGELLVEDKKQLQQQILKEEQQQQEEQLPKQVELQQIQNRLEDLEEL
jgi:hypothetical protein